MHLAKRNKTIILWAEQARMRWIPPWAAGPLIFGHPTQQNFYFVALVACFNLLPLQVTFLNKKQEQD